MGGVDGEAPRLERVEAGARSSFQRMHVEPLVGVLADLLVAVVGLHHPLDHVQVLDAEGLAGAQHGVDVLRIAERLHHHGEGAGPLRHHLVDARLPLREQEVGVAERRRVVRRRASAAGGSTPPPARRLGACPSYCRPRAASAAGAPGAPVEHGGHVVEERVDALAGHGRDEVAPHAVRFLRRASDASAALAGLPRLGDVDLVHRHDLRLLRQLGRVERQLLG